MSVEKAPVYSFERVWFLDAYGHILCHAPYSNGLNRVPFLGLLLRGFVASPYPLPSSFVPTWWAGQSTPLDMPEFVMQTTIDGLVTFQDKETGAYLSLNVQNNQTTFSGEENAWERFLPITHDMFQGLILMTDPAMGRVQLLPEGQQVGQLVFPGGGATEVNTALLGDIRIDLIRSRPSFAALGRLAVGETVTLPLALHESDERCEISATRLKPLAGEG